MVPIRWRIRSFGPTIGGNFPVTTTLIVAGTSTFTAVPSAQTLAISVAPMPKANAPSAPWLVVWESVPTTTAPGPDVPAFRKDLVADAAHVAADVVELLIAWRATNSRTFFWLLAVFADSAGTRWSKMIATLEGSQTWGSSPVPS